MERERMEKEKVERERREQERLKREQEDRERKESIAAVNKHFTESLRLASQKAAAGTWTPSITLGLPKPSPMNLSGDPAARMHSAFTHVTPHHAAQEAAKKQDEKLYMAQAQEASRHHSSNSHHAHHMSESRHHPTDNRHHPAESRHHPADQRHHTVENRHHTTDSRQHHPESHHHPTESRHHPADSRHPLDNRHAQERRHLQGDEKVQLTIQQEQLLRQQIMKHQDMLHNAHVKAPPAHQGDIKHVSQASFGGYPSVSPSSAHSVKQEPNFSLYGYQPFQQHTSYIAQEKLFSQGLKDDKTGIKEENLQQGGKRGGGLTSPPPLIKDAHGNPKGSVIVENKKEGMQPLPAHMKHSPAASPAHSHSSGHHGSPAHHGSITLGTAGMSPRSTPGHEVRTPPAAAHMAAHSRDTQQTMPMALVSKRSHSPLRVASPQQLSAAVIQPMELQKSQQPQQAGTPQQNTIPQGEQRKMYNQRMSPSPVAVQSQPAATSQHYSLIQQGLVANPIYSHSSSMLSSKVSNIKSSSPLPPHNQPPTVVSPGAGSPGSNQKRRSPKEQQAAVAAASARKRPKMDVPVNMTAHPVPATTTPVLTNSHPYTVPSSHLGVNSNSLTTTASTTSTSSKTVQSGFMDSFRSFVENTVQNTYYQDQEFSNKHPKGRHKPGAATAGSSTSFSSNSLPNTSPSLTSSNFAPSPSPSLSSTSSSIHVPPAVSPIATAMSPSSSSLSNIVRPAPPSTPGGASVSSNSSIVDTINRVANGFMDTDSDTLSAPSPPPHQRPNEARASPCNKVNHTKFKKQWLQRYSDEDKKEESQSKPSPPESHTEDTSSSSVSASGNGNSSTDPKPETVKDCYVNCSYISPTKEGGSKSPISMLSVSKELGNKEDDESTSSASDGGESQEAANNAANAVVKRQVKKKRRANNSPASSTKKLKSEGESNQTSQVKPSPPSKETNVKKRVLRKGKESKKQPVSDDEAVKVRKEEEEKQRLHTKMKERRAAEMKPVTSDSEMKMEKMERKRGRKAKEAKESKGNGKEKDSKDSKDSVDSKESTSMKESSKDKKEDHSKGKKDSRDIDSEKEIDKDSSDKSEGKESKKNKDKKKIENISAALASKPLNRAPIARLKKTLEPFLQDESCWEVTPKLMKCRECKMTPNQRNKKMPNIFCRFYAFRRLRFNQKGVLQISGFSQPPDAEAEDIELWMPRFPVMKPDLDIVMAKYMIQNVGDRFCELVEQEKEAMSWVSPDSQIAWKRAVQGVREMCDVCDTTLFNMHWVCHRCGFVVCIDCFRLRTRKGGACIDQKCPTCEAGGQKWLTCSVNRQPHEPEKLMLTQIIPSDALWVVGRMVHEVREKWRIRSNCPCGQSKSDLTAAKNGVKQLINAVTQCMQENRLEKPVNGVDKTPSSIMNGSPPENLSPLSLLADVASMDSGNSLDGKKTLTKMKEVLEEKFNMEGLSDGSASDVDDLKNSANCSTLRELLTKAAGKMKLNTENNKKPKSIHNTLDDIIQQVVERNLPKELEMSNPPLKHYTPRNGATMLGRDSPIPCYTLKETSVLFPDVPHSWLDHGRLLRLHDPAHKGNLKLFQQQWRRAQPVLVSNCHKRISQDLWNPVAFAKEFGHLENDLVNCTNGVVLIGHKMKSFWEGFEHMKRRLKDEKGRPMILKLKDWPPTEDFCDIHPRRFGDLMNALPLPEYTHRSGIFNMVSRLPEFFVKPDLGPKMYNAYGSARNPKEGTTNLHLDVSDAANIMVYVGVPQDDDRDKDEDPSIQFPAAMRACEKAHCDPVSMERIQSHGEKPGALWHLYDPQDADKIRDLLNKVAKEQGEEIEAHHDPIHDQSWYLDEALRQRLLEEYNVTGYSIVQCMGDVVFIPAGAPHQVRNLHSCIKAAEDFVSPENLDSCFKLTQEFRHLSDTHSNHEDKLQVKNVIYHAIKDAVAVLRENDP